MLALDSHRRTSCAVAVGACAVLAAIALAFERPSPAVPESVQQFDDYAARLGYRIDEVRHGTRPVPRIVMARLAGLDEVGETERRKRLFVKALLPVVLTVNEAVAAEREALLTLIAKRERGQPLSRRDAAWLAELGERYGAADAAELLRRVDVVPPSLALAQAALESGWGTSRFAREGNALFGQRATDGRGLLPAGLAPDTRVRVRDFGDLTAAVAAYARNLNTHPAYSDFRARRAELRARGEMPDSLVLARTLAPYSEIGRAYGERLRGVIRENDLAAFDAARLAGDATAPPATGRGAVPILRGRAGGSV